MKKVPCIRNLDDFKKKGCPEKCYDPKDGSGCPAWVEILITPKDDPRKPINKQGMCIDHWKIELKLRELALLEGNQQATESFRNGMVFIDKHGQTQPKPDPATITLLNLVYKAQQGKQLEQQDVEYIESNENE